MNMEGPSASTGGFLRLVFPENSIYHQRGVNIISIAMDAPGDVISALSGKIGRLAGVTAKTVYAPEAALN